MHRKTALFALLVTFIAPTTALADVSSVVSGSLLPGWRTESGTHIAALKIELADGWKTYWRAPGDAGIPPQFDWTGSRNIESVEIHWPSPEVFETNGMRSIGYTGDVVLPLEFTPVESGAPLTTIADVSIGVCKDVCIPATLQIGGDLSPDHRSMDPEIVAALSDRPKTQVEAGVGTVKCSATPIEDGMRVTAAIPVKKLGSEEVTVFELPDQAIWISETQTTRDGNILTATAEMVPPNAQPFGFSRRDLRITIIASGTVVDIEGCTG